MTNVFQLASNDQAVYYLGQIFGNVGFALAGTGPALMATMFKTFNTALLAIGALIVSYTTVVGVMATAQEGELLGKKWHALWVPLRMVGGIAALFPTQSGYCAIQVIMMWLIVQGVGAADMVWKSAVDYIGKGGAIQSAPPSDAIMSTTPNIMKQLFASAVCQSVVTKVSAKDPTAVGHSTPLTDNNGAPNGYGFGRPTLNGDPESVTYECGMVSWPHLTNGVMGMFAKMIGLDIDHLSPDDQARLQQYINQMQTAQTQAMQTLVPVVESLSDYYVNLVIADPNCWTVDKCTSDNSCNYFNEYKTFNNSSSCIVSKSSDAWNKMVNYAGSNFVLDSAKLLAGYANNYAVNNALNIQNNISGTTISSDISDPYRQAEANGWIFAGAYFYYIALNSNSLTDTSDGFINSITVNSSDPNMPIADISSRFRPGDDVSQASYPDLYVPSAKAPPIEQRLVQNLYCGRLQNTGLCQMPAAGGGLAVADAATAAMNNAISQGGGVGNIGGAASSAASSMAFGNISNIQKDIMQGFTTLIAPQGQGSTTNTNPLVHIQQFGHSLLVGAEVLFWLFFAAALVLGFASTPVIVLGNTVNYLSGLSGVIFNFLQPVVIFMLGYMIAVGGMLGVYTPLIPYIFFTFGAIGWFLAVIDAMVAGPIVALGILSPGGQHEILGRAEPGTMIILNVCLRPTLMVIGMMAAMLLTYVVVSFINSAFYNVMTTITKGNVGLFETFIYVMAYAGLIIAALNKCFTLIYLLPDQLLRWIGGHAEAFGEKAAEAGSSEVKGKVGAGTEAVTATAKSGLGAGDAISKTKHDAKEALKGKGAKNIMFGGDGGGGGAGS